MAISTAARPRHAAMAIALPRRPDPPRRCPSRSLPRTPSITLLGNNKLRTGKKRQHANAETEWERVDNFAPALVEADLWERVQNRLREDRAKWSAQHYARKGTKYLIVAMEKRIEESHGLLQPLLMPRTAAVRDYVTGDASIFQGGDLARDKEFLTRVVEGILVSADGAIVMRFRDDTLFARVAAYEFRADSPPATGPRDRRRRDHLWDTSVFG